MKIAEGGNVDNRGPAVILQLYIVVVIVFALQILTAKINLGW